MNPTTVHFGRTAGDYSRHRAGFPPGLLDRLAARSIGLPGQQVLDVGAGTGTLARQFAARGCHVTALDPSAEMLAEAHRLAHAEGLELEIRIGSAEQTGLPTGAFDTVTAGQCWHWFDGHGAARESQRVLKPGGRLVIAHFDWLPLRGNLVEATERLIVAHNPEWRFGGGNGIHTEALDPLCTAGFGEIEMFSFDVSVPYSHESWRGRIRASAGVGASLPPEAVGRFDSELAELLRTRFPDEPLSVPHRVFALTARRGGGGDPA